MFWPVIRKIGGLILSKFRYYNAIRRKTKKVEVRLFEKMKSYDRYTHFLLHPGREYRKRVRTNLLARKAGVSKPFKTAAEVLEYAKSSGLELEMNLQDLEHFMTKKRKDKATKLARVCIVPVVFFFFEDVVETSKFDWFVHGRSNQAGILPSKLKKTWASRFRYAVGDGADGRVVDAADAVAAASAVGAAAAARKAFPDAALPKIPLKITSSRAPPCAVFALSLARSLPLAPSRSLSLSRLLARSLARSFPHGERRDGGVGGSPPSSPNETDIQTDRKTD